jgi:serine/threonine-protein kinase HipA
MALKLNGKDDRLRRTDFRTLAATAGMKAGDADDAINSLLESMKEAVNSMKLPAFANFSSDGKAVDSVLEIVRNRLVELAR